MNVACSKCGAPLEATPGASSVRCQYCGTLTTIQQQQPQQPQVIIVNQPVMNAPPPQHVAFDSAGGDVAAAAVRRSGCSALFSLAITGFVMVIIGVAVIVPLMSAGVIGSVPGFGWDGTSPLVCTGNGSQSASDITAQLPGEVAVEAGGNCRIELEGVDLDADQVIYATGNAHVTVRNSTLRTRQPIRLEGNARIELRNTTVISDGAGFEMLSNGRVNAHGGQVQYVGQPFIGRANRFNAATTQLVPRP